MDACIRPPFANLVTFKKTLAVMTMYTVGSPLVVTKRETKLFTLKSELQMSFSGKGLTMLPKPILQRTKQLTIGYFSTNFQSKLTLHLLWSD